jgi:hemoglobin
MSPKIRLTKKPKCGKGASLAWLFALAFLGAAPAAGTFAGTDAPDDTSSKGAIAATGSSAGAAKSLYTRLGGKPSVRSLVGDYVDRLAADPRLLANPNLKGVSDRLDRKQVKEALFQSVCHAAGGPCSRRKVLVPNAPKNMQLQPLEWMYVIGDLNSVLDQHHVPSRERTELLGLLLKSQAPS